VIAAAARDPRLERLADEWEKLRRLNAESDHVHAEPVHHRGGGPPEEYRVTFRCRGIVGIDANQNPLFGEEHCALIRVHEGFPWEPPLLRWETPIWHPNIQHEEPHGVCVNKNDWLGEMGLDDLARTLFEMIQFKNYHAELVDPYPLDREVARWVREVGEPRGYFNKRLRKYVDDRPFTRPTASARISFPAPVAPPPRTAEPRIRLLGPTQPTTPPASSTNPRIRLVTDD
jgi:ubiquitin-protein ligase